MFDESGNDQITLSSAQIETLARVVQSFDARSFAVRGLHGADPDHKDLIAASAAIFSGSGASWTGEWIIRADGEVLSRAGAAAEPDEWLREDQASV